MRNRRFVVGGSISVLLLIAGGGVPASSVAANGDGDGQKQVRSFRTTTSGMVVQRIRQGDVEVTTYGSPNSRVRVSPQGKGEKASVAVDVKEAPIRARTNRIAPTVYEMTLESGNFTAKEACEFAKGMDGYGCKTSKQVMAQRENNLSRSVSGPKYQSTCYDFRTYKGDGSKWSHNCVVRKVDSKTKRHVYYGNKMKATGGEDDTGWNTDGISGVGIRAEYKSSSATAVEWSPDQHRDVGSSCKTITTSVTGKRGASYSQSGTVCTDRIQPWNSPKFQYFGSKWFGPEARKHHTRSTIAASLVRVPRNSTGAYAVRAYLRWN